MSVCQQKKFENASSRVAKVFSGIILNTNNDTGTFLYLIHVKAVLFAIILTTHLSVSWLHLF